MIPTSVPAIPPATSAAVAVVPQPSPPFDGAEYAAGVVPGFAPQ